eukprot:3749172-Rhodomonas_salina.1
MSASDTACRASRTNTAICLRARYAMSGTGLGRSRCSVRAAQSAVLSERIGTCEKPNDVPIMFGGT